MPNANAASSSSTPSPVNHDDAFDHRDHHLPPLHIVFIHLDLGIGGAEQLVLQLAQTAVALGHPTLELVTTRCDSHHCFASVAPGGELHDNLRVWGSWIPQDVFGKGRAVFSTLRLLYLAFAVSMRSSADVIVLDVLPTPMPLLQLFTSSSILFYCHFPDQLLTRTKSPGFLQRCYRQCLNAMEAFTMGYADVCCVNSHFTRETVESTFRLPPELLPLPILYPALDTAQLEGDNPEDNNDDDNRTKTNRIVSLNRYERKKNLGLLIEAAAWLQTQNPSSKSSLPEIIIAGGYDRRNVENVEYRAELAKLAAARGVSVTFLQSISDATRSELLRTALCTVYTPSGEHFGIVPLESMVHGTPVVAVRDGGPTETVIHGETGFLCAPTAEAFGTALQTLWQNPDRARAMGRAGKTHVLESFGPQRMKRDFGKLLEDTCRRGIQRRSRPGYRLARSLVYLCEAATVLLACWLLTWMLRRIGLLHETESILGGIQNRLFGRDEL